MKLYKSKITKNTCRGANLSLTEIANHLGLDKGDINPKLTQWHEIYPQHITMGYTNVYERYMQQYRELPINILQIGVCDKRFPYGSLKMWQTYFNLANIYGADNYFGNTLDDHLQQIIQVQDMQMSPNVQDWSQKQILLYVLDKLEDLHELIFNDSEQNTVKINWVVQKNS